MKKIGFIDFYLSEWHANNYPGWIKESCEKTGKEFTVAYAWAELDQSPSDGMTSAEWCRKFGCELCGSIEEVCEKSDYIICMTAAQKSAFFCMDKAKSICLMQREF